MVMNGRRFHVAVAGTGFIGPVHVEALRRAGQYVTGILGSTPGKSRDAADRLGIDNAYRSLDELLSDASLDAVHVAVPNHLHFDMVSRILEAGRHVMCEKPLATDRTQSARLVNLAAQSGRAAAVAYNVRFYPLCQEAAERIRAGRLGRILHVCGSYVQDWLLFPTDFNWRVVPEEAGPLRAVADIGTHWMDLVQFMTGSQIQSVCADLATFHPRRLRPASSAGTFARNAGDDAVEVPVATEDYGSILFRMGNGARGALWVSQATAGRKNCLRWEIAGEREAMAWNSERPNELWIGKRDSASESLIRDPALMGDAARRATSYPGGHNEGYPDTFKHCFRSFYDHVAAGQPDGTPPFPTFADGHHEIVVCEAVKRSDAERRWVDIEGTTK